MGGVEDDRPAEALHDRQTAHIHHQVVIAEGRAALSEKNRPVSGGGYFLRGQADIERRNELALLDIHRAAGAPGFDQQIGLAAQERGDLQDVGGFGGLGGLPGFVDIGEDGDAAWSRTVLRMRTPSFKPGPR